jgi:hypothetical protein
VRGALNWRSERPLPTWLLFGIVLLVFAILIAGSLPDVLSLDLWVFKDRGSLLNMDRLIDQGLRPGIDAYYSYGLLPLLIQRVLFRLFGRDFWPILACNLIYFLLIAAGWTLVIRALSRHRLWMLVLAALSPLVISVNPTLPYSLVMLSMLWALVLVLYGRGSWALAVAAVGCVSVPSVPLVLAALLVVMIVIEWWLDGSRRIGGLVWRLLPGAVTYGLLVSVLVAAFGIGPMLATATPLTGMAFYKSVHYSLFGSAMAFLHPPGTGVGYYLQSPVVWFVVGELMVWGLGVAAITLMIRRRRLLPAAMVVVLCAALEAFYVFAAFGSVSQHGFYDQLIVAGVVIGLATLPVGLLRAPLLTLFVVCGLFGHILQLRWTVSTWRYQRPVSDPAPLFARLDWSAEWRQILALAAQHHLLLLSYGTGVQQYFPQVHSPEVWFLQVGQLLPADHARLMRQIAGSDVLVEDLTGPTDFIDHDPAIQSDLSTMCRSQTLSYFRVWTRAPCLK